MSIRTTVTLDEDVIARVKDESRSRSASFRDTLNDLLRAALLHLDTETHSRRMLEIPPFNMGFRPGLNHDSIGELREYGEGPDHR